VRVALVDNEVVITGLIVTLVYSSGVIGRSDGVKETLTVLKNNGVEDAVCVSTLAADGVIFRRGVVPVTKVSGVVVDIVPATSKLLNIVILSGNSPVDVTDVGNVAVGDEELALVDA